MIYFAQAVSGGPVKIGHSANVGLRATQLRAHYGADLAILGTLDGGPDEERAVHARFSHLRLGKTEQFHPGPDLMEFIEAPDPSDPVAPLGTAGDRMSVINLKGSRAEFEYLRRVAEKRGMGPGELVRLLVGAEGERLGAGKYPPARPVGRPRGTRAGATPPAEPVSAALADAVWGYHAALKSALRPTGTTVAMRDALARGEGMAGFFAYVAALDALRTGPGGLTALGPASVPAELIAALDAWMGENG